MRFPELPFHWTGSGTDALLLALKAVGVAPGDEVITSAFSFVASATTVIMAGATPVFVDVDPATYNLDPEREPGGGRSCANG